MIIQHLGMAEYLDVGTPIHLLWTHGSLLWDKHKLFNTHRSNGMQDKVAPQRQRRRFVDPKLFEVRQSVLVAGINREAVLKVKSLIAGLSSEPLPLESFHVKQRSDLADGALLVPKVVLAAAHCPGRKLLDQNAERSGQLDFLYDEVCKIGADVLLVYVDLPRIIYPPNKSFIYHHRAAELLFRDQPMLQSLAMENAFVSLTAATGFNHIQRNAIREWLSRTVSSRHPVYQSAAGYLTEVETDYAAYWSQSDQPRRTGIPPGLASGWDQLRRGFESAVEGRGRPRRTRRKKKHWYGKWRTGGDTEERRSLIGHEPSSSTRDSQELLTFNDTNNDVTLHRYQSSTTYFIQPFQV